MTTEILLPELSMLPQKRWDNNNNKEDANINRKYRKTMTLLTMKNVNSHPDEDGD